MRNTLTTTPITATSVTSPKSNTEGKKVNICTFKLSDIPTTMRKKGWSVAPALMERWFKGQAWEMTKDQKVDEGGTLDIQRTAEQIDTSTVTMAWLLQFPRAKAVYDSLLDESNGIPMWKNEAALRGFKKKLHRDGKFTTQREYFGQGLSVPLLHHHCFLNQREAGTGMVEQTTAPLDDLYGALGSYLMRMAGAGYVEPIKDVNGKVVKHRVHLQRVGVFIRDTYDFIGDQPLGLWSFNDVKRGLGIIYSDVKNDKNCSEIEADKLSKKKSAEEEKYFEVENSDFEAYRKKFSKGGDFVIYSDVVWRNVSYSWEE